MYYVHGLSYEPLFNVLSKIHYRCENENHSEYKNYGGRGITVCKEWSMDNAAAFISWAKENGWKPGLQIDRIDNNKGYQPDNCRFVTRKENCRNKSNNVYVEINGETMLLCDAVVKYAVCPKKVFETRYYHYRWSLAKSLWYPYKPCESRKTKKGLKNHERIYDKASGLCVRRHSG